MSGNESQGERRASQRRNSGRSRRQRNIPFLSKLEALEVTYRATGRNSGGFGTAMKLLQSWEKNIKSFNQQRFCLVLGQKVWIFSMVSLLSMKKKEKILTQYCKIWRILHRRKKMKHLSLMCFIKAIKLQESRWIFFFMIWGSSSSLAILETWKRDFFKTKSYRVWKWASEQNC